MNRVLIGVHGKPRSGKDTLATHLVEKYKLLRYGPSMPVKVATAAMFDIPIEYLYDDKMKDAFDAFWQMSYREMAQKVGKESIRDIFVEDFWMRHTEKMWIEVQKGLPIIDILAEAHNTYNGMILADIRYANEVTWVKDRGGIVIFVTRENRGYVANEQHAAEKGLDLALADIIVPNNGTIEQLYSYTDLIVAPLIGA